MCVRVYMCVVSAAYYLYLIFFTLSRLMHISASKIVADTNVAHVTPNQDCHLKELHKQHIERYSRQLLLPEFGVEGLLFSFTV